MKKIKDAECHHCPLREADFVPPEANKGAQFAVIGNWPTDAEVDGSRPFLGPAGNFLTAMFGRHRVNRGQVHWTLAVCCQPPGNDMKKFLATIRKRNKAIKKENRILRKNSKGVLPVIPSPIDCCAPRLRRELHPFHKLVPCGNAAVKAVLHSSATIKDLRGGPTEILRSDGSSNYILPMYHPAYVQASPKFTHILAHDVKRAVNWFRTGQLSWSPPEIIYNPSPENLRQFLKQPDIPFWTYDTETDGIECLTANLRCIGIGTPTVVVVVGFLRIDGSAMFYDPQELWEIMAILKEFFESPDTVIAGHNSGYYDLLIMRERLEIEVTNNIDTMLLHRLVESELPHSLGFVGSMYSEAPSWKTDRQGRKKAYGSETDHELHEYCAYDVAVTASVLPKLMAEVVGREQKELISCDHKLQRICADMHAVGLYVDQAERLGYERKTLQKISQQRKRIRELTGRENLNPASTQQLRDLLFNEWDLDPPLDDRFKFTMNGDPSTGDDVLRSLLSLRSLTEKQRETIGQIRYYRRNQKILGTYITKLRFSTEEAWGGWDDEDRIEQEWRERYGLKKLGIVDPKTGRMYPGYNAHVTTSGRLSSSKPINAQNFPGYLRSMVCASPGNVFVGADADQLELRIAASRWGSERYLEAFRQGLDPHSSVTSVAVFGDMFMKAAGSAPPWPTGYKFKGNAKRLRGLAKSVQYASQYWATVETVHRVITQTETENDDGTTSLPYIRMSIREVRKMHKKWCQEAQFEAGWKMEMDAYKKDGFIREPVMGRRRDFLNGENPNEIINFPIQAAGASLMNIALIELSERIPFAKWGPGTGIVNQCHDSIMVECPESAAEWTKKQINECMNLTHPAFPDVKFTAEAEIGHRWSEV